MLHWHGRVFEGRDGAGAFAAFVRSVNPDDGDWNAGLKGLSAAISIVAPNVKRPNHDFISRRTIKAQCFKPAASRTAAHVDRPIPWLAAQREAEGIAAALRPSRKRGWNVIVTNERGHHVTEIPGPLHCRQANQGLACPQSARRPQGENNTAAWL
jgi:hypothetical protein